MKYIFIYNNINIYLYLYNMRLLYYNIYLYKTSKLKI